MDQIEKDGKFYISFDAAHYIECGRMLDERDADFNTKAGLQHIWERSVHNTQGVTPRRDVYKQSSLMRK